MKHNRRGRRRGNTRRRRQLQIRMKMTLSVLVIFIVGLVLGLMMEKKETTKEKEQAREAAAQAEKETNVEKNDIRIRAVGDNLIHEAIYQSADRKSDEWNYDHLYEMVRDDIQQADMAAVNQECILVSDHAQVSGYPAFGAPTEVGDALVKAGFDVIEHATNHVMDKGVTAIRETLSFWENNYPDVTVLGIHDSRAAAEKIAIVKRKDASFALLNYTNEINVEDTSELPDYMVDTMDMSAMAADVKKAKQEADMVIVFLHAGTEYASQPDQNLKDFISLLLNAEADIVICSHPHVLQNYEILTGDNGHQMLVYYSLGNFISSQKKAECMLSGMADIVVHRDETSGELSIAQAGLVPLVMHYNHDRNQYRVYKLEDYTEELASEHGIHDETDEIFTRESLEKQYEAVLQQDYHTLESAQ